jgi:hypothetical protein
MNQFHRLYRDNINGVIITLVVHIFIFTLLYLSQFKIKNEVKETELIIDFSLLAPVPPEVQKSAELNNDNEASAINGSVMARTNTGSNRASTSKNKNVDEQYERELEAAQNLVKEVSRQLNREIPTIEDLKMPDASPVKPDEMHNKIYSGESNIEYYLEKRFHIKLPIPVYLAEKGGKVKVLIVVDQEGQVTKAEPIIEPYLSEQILSYAKTAALRTRFNPDSNAPVQQNGYIVYTFIPQR